MVTTSHTAEGTEEGDAGKPVKEARACATVQGCLSGLKLRASGLRVGFISQRTQYPLIKEYTSNPNIKPPII